MSWEHEPTPSHDLTGLPLLSHSPRGQKEGQQASLTPRTGSHHFYRGHPPRPQALWEDQAVLWRWLFLSSLRALKTVTPQNQWAPLILLSLALIVAVILYFPLSLFKPLWSMCVFVCADMSDSLQPHGLECTRLLYPWNSPGKKTGRHSFLQGIFPIQGLNPYLLYYRQILIVGDIKLAKNHSFG